MHNHDRDDAAPPPTIAELRHEIARLLTEEHDQTAQAQNVAQIAIKAVHIARNCGEIDNAQADRLTKALTMIQAELDGDQSEMLPIVPLPTDETATRNHTTSDSALA